MSSGEEDEEWCEVDVDGSDLDELSPSEAFRQSLREYVSAKEDMIRVLRHWASEARALHRKERMACSGGNLLAVTGAGMTVAGGVMTALSFGAAAPVLLAGVTIGVGGAATAAGAAVLEKVKEQGIRREIGTAEETCRSATSTFEQESLRFVDYCAQLRQKNRGGFLNGMKVDAAVLARDLVVPARLGTSVGALLVATAPELTAQGLSTGNSWRRCAALGP